MSKLDIIRTWKDKQYRNTFDSEQQALFFSKAAFWLLFL